MELDFLRGIAILLVLDYHAPVHWLSAPLHWLGFPEIGWTGVSIFFVLSGFLVGSLLVREWMQTDQIDSRRFLLRRGLKIWPQYYVFLLLMLLSGHRSLHALWGNLLSVQNYTGGIPHTWSLAVEEHAYLLLALGLMLAARSRWRPRRLAMGIAAVCATVVIERLVLMQHGYAGMSRTHTRIEGILYGVLLAMVYHFRPETFRRWQAKRWMWSSLLLLALIFLRFQGSSPAAVSLGWDAGDLLGLSLLMLLYSSQRSPVQRPLWYRTVAWIGVYSYGIYLWHVSVIAPVSHLAQHVSGPARVLCLAVLPIASGILLGALMTRVVELPVLAWRERVLPRGMRSPLSRTEEPVRHRQGAVAREAVPEPAWKVPSPSRV